MLAASIALVDGAHLDRPRRRADGAVRLPADPRAADRTRRRPCGQTTPHFPLYLVEALCVEGVALLLAVRRPVVFGAVAGAAIGTFGLAAEWGWSHVWMTMSWPSALLPEAVIFGLLRPSPAACSAARSARARPARRGPRPLPALGRRPRGRRAGRRARVPAADLRAGEHARAGHAHRGLRPAGAQGRRRGRRRRADAAETPSGSRRPRGRAAARSSARCARLPGVYRSTEPIPVYGKWKSHPAPAQGDVVARPADLPARGHGDPGQGGPRRGADDARLRARQEEPPARAEEGRAGLPAHGRLPAGAGDRDRHHRRAHDRPAADGPRPRAPARGPGDRVARGEHRQTAPASPRPARETASTA